MADWFGAAESLFSGAGSFLAGQSAAAGSKSAAAAYSKAAQLTKVQTGLRELSARRQIYQTISGAEAAVGASGLQEAGSAATSIANSTREGSLTRSIIENQGQIEYSSYIGKAQAAAQQAKAQSSGGFLGAIGGVIGAAASIFSDDRMKTDIVLLERRLDGLGIYQFRYTWDDENYYKGVLASEVEHLYPAAVTHDPATGARSVDYDAIGVELTAWRN